jgi:hypothetical protein
MKTQLSLLVLLLGLLPVLAMDNEVWISPLGPVNPAASGTPASPFRCPDARSLTGLFKSTFATATGSLLIHFMPGQFSVANPGLQVRPGWKIRGAGIDSTFMQLQTNAANGVAATVFYADSADNAEISDMTIDCNYQNQTNPRIITAISLTGSNVRISRVKAINWGTAGRENFVIDISNDGIHHNINDVIEDCIVTQPAPVIFGGGVSALSIFTDGPKLVGAIRGAIYRNNFVYGVCSGTGGVGCPAYFHAYMDGAGGVVANNFAYDLTGPGSVGIYRDSWNGRDVVIEGNVFDNVSLCIYFNLTRYHLTGVVLQSNVLRPAEGGTGILYNAVGVENDTNAFARDLVAAQNVIYPSATATNVRALVLVTRRASTVVNNVLQGGGNYADSSIAQPSYPFLTETNTVSGNVNLSGRLR